MLTFNIKYFVWFLLLLAIEIIIAFFIKDNFVRPYLGDFLVVILLYTIVKSFFNISVNKVLFGVLLFAFFVEFLQYHSIITHIGLTHSTTARILIGTSFSWIDMGMYVLGIFSTLMIEKYKPSKIYGS